MKARWAALILFAAVSASAQQPAKVPESKPAPQAPAGMVAAPSTQNAPASKAAESCTELGYMRWGFYSEGAKQNAVELVVTDPRGRRVGNDPVANKHYDEVPRASYGYEGLDDDESDEPGPETGVVEFCNPEPGEYKVQVFAKDSGRYSLEVYASSREALGKNGLPESVQSSAMLDNLAIKKGAMQALTVKYSREPGEKVEVVK